MTQTKANDSSKSTNIKYVSIAAFVKPGNDVPYDYPFLFGEMWHPIIEIATGQICNFKKQDTDWHLHIKAADNGVYTLFDKNLKLLHQYSNYVPHGLIPGEYGDYIILDIDKTGLITNWLEEPSFEGLLNDQVTR